MPIDIPREPSVLRFGPFELDLAAGELSKDGVPLKLPPQPFRALAFLASRAGAVVTRDELRRAVWGDDEVVDFEHGLNFCILQVRTALADDAQNPTYVKTLPRRGYRFVAPVEKGPLPEAPAAVPPAEIPRVPARRPSGTAAAIVAVVVALVAVSLVLSRRAPPVLPARAVLAVLPFESLGGGDDDHFGDGLTEELITRLGRLDPERLGVIARTSVMRLKGNRADLAALGRGLGVDHVLEGSVRRGSGTVRITAQLIRVSDQTHLWAETYDRPLADVLAIQDEVAGRVARSLSVRLLPATAPAPYAAAPAAYEAFLKGRSLVATGGPAPLAGAVKAFEGAIALDPRFARAHAALADALHQLRMRDSLPPRSVYPKAEAAARRAVALDPTLAEAHAALGAVLLWYRWDTAGSRRELRKALSLNPYLAPALHDLAFLVAGDEPEEAIAAIRRAREIDPLSPRANLDVGWLYLRTGRYDDALAQCRLTLELEPGLAGAEACVAEAHLRRGELLEAFRFTRQLIERSGASAADLASLDGLEPRDGLLQARRLRLARLKARAASGYVSGYSIAVEEAALGDVEAAVASLRGAFDAREAMLYRLETDPAFEALRKNAGFLELARRVREVGSGLDNAG